MIEWKMCEDCFNCVKSLLLVIWEKFSYMKISFARSVHDICMMNDVIEMRYFLTIVFCENVEFLYDF